MNKQQIMEHIDIVKKYHSRNAEEISDALDMLNYSLEELSNKTRDEQTRALKNKDFTKGDELWELSKFVSTVQSEISEYSAAMLCGEENEEDDSDVSDDEQTTAPVAPHILCKPRLRWLRSTGAKLAFAPLAAN